MGQVSFTVNDHPYQLACEDGQEERLESLAKVIDQKVVDLVSTLGHLGQDRLLLMASILLLDDATEQNGSENVSVISESILLDAAHRIEAVAAQLETP